MVRLCLCLCEFVRATHRAKHAPTRHYVYGSDPAIRSRAIAYAHTSRVCAGPGGGARRAAAVLQAARRPPPCAQRRLPAPGRAAPRTTPAAAGARRRQPSAHRARQGLAPAVRPQGYCGYSRGVLTQGTLSTPTGPLPSAAARAELGKGSPLRSGHGGEPHSGWSPPRSPTARAGAAGQLQTAAATCAPDAKGKWIFEVRCVTDGEIRVGWARRCSPDRR